MEMGDGDKDGFISLDEYKSRYRVNLLAFVTLKKLIILMLTSSELFFSS